MTPCARIYLPTLEAIRREGLDGAAPEATDADLFLCVYQRRRELVPECGCDPLELTVGPVAEERRAKRRGGLRRLLLRAG